MSNGWLTLLVALLTALASCPIAYHLGYHKGRAQGYFIGTGHKLPEELL